MFLLARLEIAALWAIMLAGIQQNLVTEPIARALEVLLYSKLSQMKLISSMYVLLEALR